MKELYRWELTHALRELSVLVVIEQERWLNLALSKQSMRTRARDAIFLLNGMAGEW